MPLKHAIVKTFYKQHLAYDTSLILSLDPFIFHITIYMSIPFSHSHSDNSSLFFRFFVKMVKFL